MGTAPASTRGGTRPGTLTNTASPRHRSPPPCAGLWTRTLSRIPSRWAKSQTSRTTTETTETTSRTTTETTSRTAMATTETTSRTTTATTETTSRTTTNRTTTSRTTTSREREMLLKKKRMKLKQ